MSISQSIVAINTYLLTLAPHVKERRAAQLLIAARDALQRQREALQLLEDQLRFYSLKEQEGQWHIFDADGEGIVCGDTLEKLVDALYELEHPKAGEL